MKLKVEVGALTVKLLVMVAVLGVTLRSSGRSNDSLMPVVVELEGAVALAAVHCTLVEGEDQVPT